MQAPSYFSSHDPVGVEVVRHGGTGSWGAGAREVEYRLVDGKFAKFCNGRLVHES